MSVEPCPYANIFFQQCQKVADMAAGLRAFVNENREAWDTYFDRLAHLPESIRREISPEACDAVERIQERGNLLCQERDAVSAAFYSAVSGKMGVLAEGLKRENTGPADAYLSAFEALRKWRISSLDGRNVDMAPLLDERGQIKSLQAGLFGTAFSAFSKVVLPGYNALQARRIVLEDLGSTRPDLAQQYLSSKERPRKAPVGTGIVWN